MIRITNLTKSFRDGRERAVILDDITLELPAANIALLGGSGSGKSTLLYLLCGIIVPDKGRIERDGLVSWPLGFRGSFSARMSSAENVRFVARMYGQDTDLVIDYVREFCDFGEDFDLPLGEISKNLRDQLAYGVSMAIDFGIYLVDEVIEIGNPRFREKCRTAFNSRLERSRLIMVSKDLADLKEYCELGLVLHAGQLTLYDDLEEAIAEYQELGLD